MSENNDLKTIIANQKIMHDAEVKHAQDKCLHLQGCNILSETFGPLSAIVWHTFDDGVERGLCLNCLRRFEPTDPDYNKYWQLSRGCEGSTATTKVIPISEEEYLKEASDQNCFVDTWGFDECVFHNGVVDIIHRSSNTDFDGSLFQPIKVSFWQKVKKFLGL